jgi:MbtH protein
MLNPFDDDNQEFYVLINDEGQYSLWPTFKKIPKGWTAVGQPGARKDCVAYIQATWTDLRPLSLIKQMERDLPA